MIIKLNTKMPGAILDAPGLCPNELKIALRQAEQVRKKTERSRIPGRQLSEERVRVVNVMTFAEFHIDKPARHRRFALVRGREQRRVLRIEPGQAVKIPF